MAPEHTLEQDLVDTMKSRRTLLAFAESCTGGLLAHRITNVPGSSQVFWRAWISYQNAAKTKMLGADAATLAREGAVTEYAARAMAEGGLERMRASGARADLLVCVATTGVAGPDPDESGKPVGTCYVAVARSDRPTQVEALLPSRFQGSREELKKAFATAALRALELSLSL